MISLPILLTSRVPQQAIESFAVPTEVLTPGEGQSFRGRISQYWARMCTRFASALNAALSRSRGKADPAYGAHDSTNIAG